MSGYQCIIATDRTLHFGIQFELGNGLNARACRLRNGALDHIVQACDERNLLVHDAFWGASVVSHRNKLYWWSEPFFNTLEEAIAANINPNVVPLLQKDEVKLRRAEQ